MCFKSLNFKPTLNEMKMIGIFHRILRSVLFNVMMLVLGFGIGFFSIAINVHCQAVANDEYVYITRIEEKLRDLHRMDMEYTEKQQEFRQIIDDFKLKLSHRECNFKRLNPF